MTTKSTYTIGLRFPYSTSENDYPQVFKISYNTASQSDFIRTLLENEDEGKVEDDIQTYREIIIPHGLYQDIRHCDIVELFDLWNGKKIFSGPTNTHCYEDIARLSQAILISNKLHFVRSLESTFPPNHIIPVINERLAEERERNYRQIEEIQNQHNQEQAGLLFQIQNMRTNLDNIVNHSVQNAITTNNPNVNNHNQHTVDLANIEAWVPDN